MPYRICPLSFRLATGPVCTPDISVWYLGRTDAAVGESYAICL